MDYAAPQTVSLPYAACQRLGVEGQHPTFGRLHRATNMFPWLEVAASRVDDHDDDVFDAVVDVDCARWNVLK